MRILSIIWISILFSVVSCTPEINFDEPQPAGDKNENTFRKKFQGIYFCKDDSSMLTIDENKIIQEWHLIIEVPKEELDTTEGVEIRDGKIYSKDIPEPLPFQMSGDTVIINWDFELTIFKISPDQILRYYNGFYFLNYKKPDNLWVIKVLSIDSKGLLTLNKLQGGSQQIEEIKQITHVDNVLDDEGKVVTHKIHPTRRELREILRSDMFVSGSEFKKIKLLNENNLNENKRM